MRTASQVLEVGTQGCRYLVLELREDSEFESLAKAMAALGSVHYIKLVCRVGQSAWENNNHTSSHSSLFKAIGSLRNVKTLTIDGFGIDENDEICYPLPMSLLTTLFTQPSCRLDFVSINRLCLLEHGQDPNGSSILEFTRALQSLALEKLTMTFINNPQYNGNPNRASRFYNSLLRALTNAPKIRRVFLWHDSDFHQPSLDAETVGKFCRSVTLKKLVLKGFGLDDACLLEMGKTLETNESHLEWLMFDLNDPFDIGALSFTRALATNRTLRVLQLKIGNKVEQDVLIPEIAKSLIKNQMLRDLRLDGQVGNTGPFLSMLRSNCELESLSVSADEATQSQIDLYLRLNTANRRCAMHEFDTMTSEEWVDLLAGASTDLDCLNYFLHANPCLCQPVELSAFSQQQQQQYSLRDKRTREEFLNGICRPTKRIEFIGRGGAISGRLE